MKRNILNELKNNKGTSFDKGISWDGKLCTSYGLKIRLPSSFTSLVNNTNGISVYFGFFRIFGYKSSLCFSIDEWNDPSFWKFAWGNRCDDYLCFGETAFGDQYAFSINDLQTGKERVYFIEGFAMSPEIIADDFNTFLENEFLQNSTKPYDSMISEAQSKFGKLLTTEHLVYSPSPLIGGPEISDNIHKLSARTAMIFNGDLALQLDESSDAKEVSGITTYKDANGIDRLKIIWGV